MTTRVKIINFGPDPIIVKHIDATGTATAPAFEEIVQPGEVSTGYSYVYDTRHIVVEEKKRG